MRVVRHAPLTDPQGGGCARRRVAGTELGGAGIAVEHLRLEAGAAWSAPARTMPRTVIVLSGGGKLRIGGEPQGFQAPCTLNLPAGLAHEVVNNGVLTLELLVIDPEDRSA